MGSAPVRHVSLLAPPPLCSAAVLRRVPLQVIAKDKLPLFWVYVACITTLIICCLYFLMGLHLRTSFRHQQQKRRASGREEVLPWARSPARVSLTAPAGRDMDRSLDEPERKCLLQPASECPNPSVTLVFLSHDPGPLYVCSARFVSRARPRWRATLSFKIGARRSISSQTSPPLSRCSHGTRCHA